MEIRRISDNQIRCAITEQEIEEMGFRIDDIISNTEEAQKFMHLILEKVEEQENINMDMTSPMVRAELLPDHSMAITFGQISEDEKMRILDHMKSIVGNAIKEGIVANQTNQEPFHEATRFALEFSHLKEAIRVSKSTFQMKELPESSLYKFEEKYYLLMDFMHLSRKEVQPLVFAALEYDERHHELISQIAYIKEHGTCILFKDALEQLRQL